MEEKRSRSSFEKICFRTGVSIKVNTSNMYDFVTVCFFPSKHSLKQNMLQRRYERQGNGRISKAIEAETAYDKHKQFE